MSVQLVNPPCLSDLFPTALWGISGAKCSPSLVNLYMGMWGKVLIFSERNHFQHNILWYGCYIDNLLMIWRGDPGTISQFVDLLNNNEYN